jgi:phosphate transport system permease protein
MSPYRDWQDLAWSGALIITLFVLILSIVARSLSALFGGTQNRSE